MLERTAAELYSTDPDAMQAWLTDYSIAQAEMVTQRWQELLVHLITKYNDGYIRDENGKYPNVGYPHAWLERVLRERPTQFLLPGETPGDTAATPKSLQSPLPPLVISTAPDPLPPQPATGIPRMQLTGQPGNLPMESLVQQCEPPQEPDNDAGLVLADNQYLVDIRAREVELYLQNREINVWRNQVAAAIKLFQLAHKRFPESEDEFIEKILLDNGIILPELRDGCVYVYLPEIRQMMILVTQ
jgi:hypothetical protein